VLVTVLYLRQDVLLFDARSDYQPPASLGLADAQEVRIATPDGEQLMAWYRPPDPGQPTLLFFHGKGGTISERPRRFAFYAAHGLGILFVEYRGYGASSGTASEAGFMIDAQASYDFLRGKGVAANDIVLVGESLGTGVAVMLAARVPSAALLLEAPYSSVVDVAADRYWYVPVRRLVRHEFNALGAIGNVHVPVLFQHGTLDESVPIGFSRKLFEAANEPKVFVEIPGANHMIFNEETWAREIDFLNAKAGFNIPAAP